MRAAAWIAAYLALVASPFLVLLFGDVPPGLEFWWDLSKALGFAAISMMGVQFALTARFRTATAPFGIDIIYFLHRYLAISAMVLAIGHFSILWINYRESLGSLNPLEASWYMTAGRVALVAFLLAVVTSEFREKLGLKYGFWRLAHIALAVIGFAAAIAHILGVGYYTQAPWKRALWLSMTLSWLALIIWVRLIKPAMQKRHPYRVSEVREEDDHTWTLVLEPDGHQGLKSFKAGQFAWLTLKSSPYATKDHPFSLSSAPCQLPKVEMTIRELGDFTSSIGSVRAGEKAYLDGPFGIFSYEVLPEAAGFVFVVGGVGITPVMSMLRSMAHRGEQRPLWVFYANPSHDRVLFKDALDRLSEQLNLTLIHIIQEPPEGWRGESGLLTKEMLEKYITDADKRRLHFFLCGPPAMLTAAEQHLRDLEVPRRHIHVEIFNL